jgi:hypothetical protein|tara:strand:+ start:1585 stop:2220 length:636 start_codon:yes stop_codon:yes gene_type:complete
MKDIKQRIKKVVEQCKKDGTYVDPETGKTCIKAASKIKYFIEEFVGEIGIETNIKTYEEFYVGVTKITSPQGGVLATGHAKVFRNKPKSFELAETFSISRALSFFSVMDDNITSKEEYDEIGIPLQENKISAEVINMPEVKQVLLNEKTSVEYIIEQINLAKHQSRLLYLKQVLFSEEFDDAIKNHPRVYRDLENAYDIRMNKLQGATKNG